MLRVDTVAGLRAELDRRRADHGGVDPVSQVGFVPTMGYLHDGHESLMHAARADCPIVVASIFVNPLQFGAGEDLESYPTDLAGDSLRAERSGVDLLFVPSADEMYPVPVSTTVSVAGVSSRMEGAARPTHFAGVATVVAKLLNIVGPCRAYFGEKDFQQIAVVRTMVADLSVRAEIVARPTVREADGLARSSRNVYLSDRERAAAPVLYRALRQGALRIAAGETDAEVVRMLMARIIEDEPVARLDYAEVVDSTTLEPLPRCGPGSRLLVAARFGRARLLDNMGVSPASSPDGGV
ncbi:MAG: pantoate--beta-alanine ligase [Microthrixaceae bacterium]